MQTDTRGGNVFQKSDIYVLIIIENLNLLKQVSRTVLLSGCRIVEEKNTGIGLDKFKQTSFDLVISELDSANVNCLEVIEGIKKINPNTPLIGVSNGGSGNVIATAMSKGAYAILHSPFEVEELQIQIKKALQYANLMQEVVYLRHARPNVVYNFNNIVGKSEKIREIFSVLQNIAKTDTPVIIYGESGTGKELIAGAIHYNSLRKENNFIKVNCAALPEQILESELFGHESGTIKGADKQRVGRLEQANHGTIFLEETSKLTLHTQNKLLRFIQKKEIKRLGGSQVIKLDVRIISATTKNLQEAIRAGKFREDLYYWLNMVPIEIPPLRQRKSDIMVLAEYFLKYFNREFGKSIAGFEEDAKRVMLEYRWPGNVRELKNAVERGVLKTDREKFALKDFRFPFAGSDDNDGNPCPAEKLSLYEVEKNTILQALQASGWIQKDAAKLLGISKRALNYKVENFNIKNSNWIKNK